MPSEKINKLITNLRATNDPDEQDEIKIEIDELEEEEYRRCVGLDSEDVGSRTLLARYLSKKCKERGWKTARLWKLPKNQLFMIMKKI